MYENLETPLRLNAIRVVGANITRPSFLAALLGPSLPSLPPPSYISSDPVPMPPTTLRNILATTRDLTGLLSQFDIFTQVDATLESSPSGLAEKDDVDIVLTVKESPRFYLRTATDVGDGEGSAVSWPATRVRYTHAVCSDGDSTDTECVWRR